MTEDLENIKSSDDPVPEMRALILGHSTAVSRLGFEFGSVSSELANGVVVIKTEFDEASWIDLVRACFRAGCACVPVENAEKALALAETSRAETKAAAGEW